MFTDEIRKKKVKFLLIWGAINCGLCAYIIFLLAIFWDAWKIDCIEILNVWLLVYLCLQAAQTVRTIIIIFIWRRAKDPAIT